MEVLSRLELNAVNDGGFKFHPGCKELGLSHLLYADDLLLFSKGDLISLHILQQVMQDFSLMSRLTMNVDKTCIYFGGFSQQQKHEVIDFLKLKDPCP